MAEHRDVDVPKGAAWVLIAEGPDEFWMQGEDNWQCRMADSQPADTVRGPKVYADQNLNVRLEDGERIYGRNLTRNLTIFVVGASE